MTPTQEGMLYHSRLNPGVYLQQLICTLDEPVEERWLWRAWQTLLGRHEILRVRFRNCDGTLWQIVQPDCPLTPLVEDWRGLSAAAQITRLNSFLAADAQQGFDFESDPLLRLALFRLSESRSKLVWTSHHALLDGRARLLLIDELFTAYDALRAGRRPELKAPLPFRNFVEWLSRRETNGDEAFWRHRLEDFRPPPPVHLGGRSDVTGSGHVERLLDSGLTAQLASFAQRHDLTLNTLVQGGWALLLAHLTGSSDVVFGAIRACRKSGPASAERIVGPLINTVPVRVRLAAEEPALQWLQGLRREWLALRDYEHTPLSAIQSWCRQAELFDSLVSFEHSTINAHFGSRDGHWGQRSFELRGATNYPLVIQACGGSRLLLECRYDRARLDDETAHNLVARLEAVLKRLIDNPATPVGDIDLVTTTERECLLGSWNETTSEYPGDLAVHQLFERQAAATPLAPALTEATQTLRYAELNERANRLARYLRERGVGPEEPVAVVMERSVDVVTTLLAILKAGGCYVPLSPEDPPSRLADLIDKSGARLCLTGGGLDTDRVAAAGVTTIDLDLVASDVAEQSGADLNLATDPAQLAYIMYTSGSTGEPKGVGIPHQGVVSLVAGDYVRLDPQETLLLLAPLSFDASTFEIWGALLNGARLALYPPTAPTLAGLADCIRDHKVSTLWLTAGLFHMMVEEGIEGLRGIRQLIAGGDVLSPTHVARVLRELPECRLVNGYGPTEATTFSTCYPVPTDFDAAHAVPIGPPVSNTRVYVLDSRLRPVAVGAPGELYIGGDGLARGYWKQPGLTAARFVPNPFAAAAGERLYRTGDRVRFRPDGTLEFLGRLDAQVKIRGFRIEPAEVEAVLGRLPGVEKAAVTAIRRSGETRLLAGVVADGVTADQLRSELRTRIPGYMVPDTITLLEQLPLTANGKLDRAVLGELIPHGEKSPLREAAAPHSPAESLLVEVWSDVLGISPPNRSTSKNFFDLGGHSLLATRLLSRISGVFDVEIPLGSFLAEPTIDNLARRIESARGSGDCSAPIPAARDRSLPAPLAFAQEPMWVLGKIDGGGAVNNVPSAHLLKGALNVPALQKSLCRLVDRHTTLRTRFRTNQGVPQQEVAAQWTFELPVIDLSHLPELVRSDELKRLGAAEAARPFDPENDLLLRGRLVQLAPDEHVLLLTAHHLATDGWSQQLLYRDLAELYRAEVGQERAQLPTLPVDYADYSRWQREWLNEARQDTLLQYWRQALDGAPRSIELPTDSTPGDGPSRGGTIEASLPAEQCRRLQQLSRTASASLSMTLLSAFSVLLGRWSGQTDLPICTAISGRGRSEVENLVGCFVNGLILRIGLDGRPTFQQLVEQVKKVSLEAFDHQHLPRARLVQELAPARGRSQHPLSNVLFNYGAAEWSSLELPDIESESLRFHQTPPKFRLTLYAAERPEGLDLRLIYRADLFSSERMECFMDQLLFLLEQAAEAPHRPIESYSLRTPASRRRLPDPSAALTEPVQRPVVAQIRLRARARPDDTAVEHKGQSWSFRQLVDASDGLAQALSAQGVRPGDVIAVGGERSFGLIAAIVATLKVGAVLLLVDDRLPLKRQQLLVNEAGSTGLVAVGEGLRELRHAAGDRLPTLCVVETDGGCAPPGCRQPGSTKFAPVDPNDPAYIFFTSGSTGRPRGVLGCHKSLSHFLAWQQTTFAIGRGDRVAQLTGLSFDVVLRDIFLPLVSGATLCLPDNADLLPENVIEWVDRSEITLLHMVPSLADLWLREDRSSATGRSLRWVFSAGEALTGKLVQRWRTRFPESSGNIVNFYGPTETTLVKCAYPVPAEPSPGVQPVGSPLPQTQAFVVSDNGQLCGVGEPGEIVLRTPFATLGYIDGRQCFSPGLTDQEGDRIYRTGDGGRFLPDGTLEFLGRLDDQIKIEGVRVEPAEVASSLAIHPAVRDCFVRGFEEGDDKLLAAWIVPDGPDVTASELRSYLRDRLPLSMVPARLIILDRLPLSANGKVDRKALPLPPPVAAPRDRPVSGRQSTTPIEDRLAEIWGRLLEVDDPSPSTDFFEAGGTSLKAAQLLARIETNFGVQLPLSALFEHSTIAGMSRLIADAAPAARASVQLSGDRAPLSFSQQRLWFLHHFLPDPTVYNICWGLRIRGPLKVAALERAIESVVRRQEVLRTRFVAEDGIPAQIVCRPETCDLKIEDLTALERDARMERLSELSRVEAHTPFRLDRDQPFRSRLFKLGDEDHVLILTCPHIVSDGWSVGIINREISRYYECCVADRPVDLAPLKTQYRHYAARQRQPAGSGDQDALLAYWSSQLRGAPVRVELPTDRPQPEVGSYRGNREYFRLHGDLSSDLARFHRQERVTLFSVLLAAFNSLLYSFSDQRDLVVGVPVAGRTKPELEEIVGLFVNTLPVRSRVDPQQSFRHLVHQTQEVLLQALSHQALPLERLVEELKPKRRQATNPLFNVLFNYGDRSWRVPTISGLEVERFRPPRQTARIDLGLGLSDDAGGVWGVFEYNLDLFDRATIVGFADDFRALCRLLIKEPDRSVQESIRRLETASRSDAPPEQPIDRRGFGPAAAEEQSFSPVSQDPSPSASLIEQALVPIWAEVLEHEQVEVDDDFFELGGHSLQAMRLIARMTPVLGVEIEVAALFRFPTIASLAAHIAAEGIASAEAPPLQVQSQPPPPPRAKAPETPEAPVPPPAGSLSGAGRAEFESRSLLSLVASGRAARIDAAALSAFPIELLDRTGWERDDFFTNWCDGLPWASTLLESPLGRIGIIHLPRFNSELYSDPERLLALSLEGLEMASGMGASVATLTGLIPSATGYGDDLHQLIASRKLDHLPAVSTGHATTVATVALNIERILKESGRDLSGERLGFVGLGSIGGACLDLVLRRLPHPAELVLCDLYTKRSELERIRDELVAEHEFGGPVRVVSSRLEAPDEFYECSLIVGATNVPDVLDVDRLRPGTLIVDDSGPHCFSVSAIRARFEGRCDVLFTEGGVLRSPAPFDWLRHLPPAVSERLGTSYRARLEARNPFEITGCVLSGLLTARFQDYPATLGQVRGETALQHHGLLNELGFSAAGLQCQGWRLSSDSIRRFRERFGGERS